MLLAFKKTSLADALKIVSWEYTAPYDVYNLRGSALALAKLTDGSYFSAFFGQELMGFFCYGTAAQLKTGLAHGLYADQAYLDVGLGLHPNYCGRGLGARFVRSGLQYASGNFWSLGFRLTVAANNLRALKVYKKVGFEEKGRFLSSSRLAPEFIVLTVQNPGPKLTTAAAR